MQRVIMMGRLVEDPTVQYTQSNTAVCKFKLAVNRDGKKVEGQPTADFFTITAWKNTAEFIGKYFVKGQQILIEGQIRNNNYTDKNGNKRYSNDIHASRVYFADSKRDSGGQAPQTEQSGIYDLGDSEDLPF